MSVAVFRKKLEKHFKKIEIDLVVNENRTTMLNLLDKRKKFIRLSVHRMFLTAPENVISAIAHYVRGTLRGAHEHSALLRGYIQTNLSSLNYASRIAKSDITQKGRVYDLDVIYQSINKKYFANKLNLHITWYGTWGLKNRARVTFGLYYDSLKLVKIHRLLDDPFFPSYFVRFVVYHEMLHAVVPGYIDEKGRFRTHGTEFKQLERQFEDYQKAIAWEKEHRDYFFKAR